MKKRSAIIVAIVFMMIGFASISTSLIINGNARVSENNEDFSIIFTAATLDGEDVYSSVVDDTKKIITFTSKNLMKIGDKSTLTYEVTNNSANYDAEVKVTCVPKDGTKAKYTSIKNELENDATIVKAKTSLNGTLTVNLDKQSTEEVKEEYTCSLEFNATERDTIAVTPINLYNMIKDNADTTTVIDYKVHSGTSGTNGIYMTTQTEGNVPVYYYRGDADKVDNNIIFNNMCWKIIRTTETGGIKIIYNGTPTEGKCGTQKGTSTQIGTSAFNTKYDDNAYVGYMYGTAGSSTYEATHANTNDSTIKTYIDNWYSQNFDESATSKLEDTIFCNDRSIVAYDKDKIGDTIYSTSKILGYGTSPTLYAIAYRANFITKYPNPTLACTQTNDRFTVDSKNGNGSLGYPVGLITNDEAIFAGFNTYAGNTNDYIDKNNYLYTDNSFWTFSPSAMHPNGFAYAGYVGNDGQIHGGYVHYNNGVRPVVSLKPNTLIDSIGDGSFSNPYKVL